MKEGERKVREKKRGGKASEGWSERTDTEG